VTAAERRAEARLMANVNDLLATVAAAAERRELMAAEDARLFQQMTALRDQLKSLTSQELRDAARRAEKLRPLVTKRLQAVANETQTISQVITAIGQPTPELVPVLR